MDVRKAQGSSLYVFIGALMVAAFALLMFVTQSGNTAQNLETLATSSISFQSQNQLKTLYSLSIPVRRDENTKIVESLAYGCEYGKKSRGYSYTISKTRPTRIQTREFLSSYLNKTLTGGYQLIVECSENSKTEKIQIGAIPPQSAERIIVTRMTIPLAQGNKTQVYLKRW